MRTGRELLAELRERDVALWSEEGKLRFRAPAGALTDELRAEIAARRAEVLLDVQKAEGGTARTIPRAPLEGELPLSFEQERVWFVERLAPGTAYHCERVVRLRGPLDVAVLRATLDDMVRRHEVLRTVFPGAADGGPMARILPARGAAFTAVGLRGAAPRAVRDRIRLEVDRPFALDAGPLFRATLIETADDDRVLVMSLHHLVTDGPSLKQMLRELGETYAALLAGRPSPLAEPLVQYADFTAWQRAATTDRTLAPHLEWWREQLEGAPPLELPTDRPRPPAASGRGASLRFRIPAAVAGALREIGAAAGATPFATFLAAFQTLLHRYAGEDDVVVAAPLTARTRTELEDALGFFNRTLVVRTDLSGDPTFRELAGRVRADVLDAWSHAVVPLQKLVEALNPHRRLDSTPFATTLFAFEEADPELRLPGIAAEPLSPRRRTAIADLDLTLREAGGEMHATLTGSSDLFDVRTIAQMARHFRRLLRGLAACPDLPIGSIPLLGDAERARILVDWNRTDGVPAPAECVHESFAAQAARTPEAAALRFGDETVSYGELDRRANRLAWRLRRHGVAPEVVVAVSFPRSPECIVAILAILKAGGAYLPLDPRFKPELLARMVRHARAALVLAPRALAAPFAETGLEVLCPEDLASEPELDTPAEVPGGAGPATLAYVMYTSGSTGEPKGVETPHGALASFVAWAGEHYAISSADRVLQYASVAFDTSVEEIFPALLRGATLVLRPVAGVETASELLETCERHGITVLDLPTAYWHELTVRLAADRLELPPAVRICIVGGEAAHAERIVQWREVTRDRVRLVNTYGPTETTVVATSFELGALEPAALAAGRVPIGLPIARTRAHVLDARLEPVPAGVAGEVYLGGAGVTRGYRDRAALTAERFVPDPFAAEPGARLYRTGDRARRRRDGNLEFLGRNDSQVKLRGFRVELADVEAALRRHLAVADAVVTCAEERGGGKRLVAYLVARPSCALDPAEVRNFLKKSLSPQMVPAAYVTLPALPLTSTGKVNRRGLPAPEPERERAEATRQELVAPRTPVERTLTSIWESLLGVRPIGIRDDFFDLGGHSLLALHLFARIEKRTGVRLPLASLFQAPTIEQQAALVAAAARPARAAALVAIQPGGSKPPLFCVHAHEGNVLFYRDLARRLGPDQPFLALQAPGLDGTETAGERVEDLAARYVAEIRAYRPSGPYALGGYCFGGSIAFEMARQLEACGERVALLALFDAFAPGYDAPARSGLLRPILRVKERTLLHAANLILLPGADRLAYVRSRMRKIAARAQMRFGLPSARSRRRVRDALAAAAIAYDPPPYAGDVTLFRATHLSEGWLHDPHLGWDGLVLGALEVHEIPGRHGTIIFEPRVGSLVAPLRSALERTARPDTHAAVSPRDRTA